ncbi:hypothetical protein XENTR_v10005224 [Xenopus tropicalis]|nr:hypothetical protein XENTR_v10005224 [Xenopus tropicalis]
MDTDLSRKGMKRKYSCDILPTKNETTTNKAIEQPLRNEMVNESEKDPKKLKTDNKQSLSRKRKTERLTERESKRQKIDSNTINGKKLWIPELNLRIRHKVMLQTPKQLLTYRIIDAAQTLLNQQFKTEGLQPCMTPWDKMNPVSGPAVQIHGDIEAGHCFTTCYRKDRVEIADSKPTYISSTVEKQIEHIYQIVVPDPLNNMEYMRVDRQPRGSNDCVIYATAFAYELLSNGNVHCRFDNAKMREHFIKCLESRRITAFPKISH